MDLTKEMELEAMQAEVKALRGDVDRLSKIVEKLTGNVDRLFVIAGGLADQVVPKTDMIQK